MASAAAASRQHLPLERLQEGEVRSADQLLDDTRRAARASAKIIAWSETAAPSTQADKAIPRLARRACAVGAHASNWALNSISWGRQSTPRSRSQ
jgi:hypothetical protein